MTLILNGTDNSATVPAVQGGTAGTTTGEYFPATNQWAVATNGTQAMLVDASQNVGIGTSSPSSYGKLTVNDTAAKSVYVRSSSTNFSGLLLENTNSATKWQIGVEGGAFNTAGLLNIGIDGVGSKMAIDSSGNVIVNATATVGTGGKFQVTSSTDTALFKTTSSTAYAAAVCNVENTAARLIAFQYGSGGSPTNVGSITTNGTVTAYNVSSDYRLKQDIAPMTGALAKVAALKPVTYKWKSDGSDGEGFIAHELAEVCPHAVTGAKDAVDEDGNSVYQGIDVSFLVATLTAAIQELKAEFDAYKAAHP
jgi:hypothetical protein